MEAKAKRAVPAPPVPVMGHRRLPKVVAKKGGLKVLKEVKQKAVMGRPKSEGCAQCRRLAKGLKGGHGHTCGKVAYSRLAQQWLLGPLIMYLLPPLSRLLRFRSCCRPSRSSA